MPAEFESGVFTENQPAWHGLGVVLPNEALNADEALMYSGLANWNLTLEPSGFQRDGIFIPAPGQFHVVRTGVDNAVLGSVGDRYTILPNEEAFKVADELVGGAGCHYKTAGSLRGGKIVWLLMETPFRVNLPDSEYHTYLLLTNRHDGWGSVTFAIVNVRVVCKNTLDMALGGAKAAYKVRHTATMSARYTEAQRVLGLTQGAVERAERIATDMLKKKLAAREIDAFWNTLVPVPTEAGSAQTRAQNKQDALRELYASSPNLADVRGTAWGLYNAVVEWNDHHAPLRDGAFGKAENRFLNIIDGDNIGTYALSILGFQPTKVGRALAKTTV